MGTYYDSCGQKHCRVACEDIVLFGDAHFPSCDADADYSYNCEYIEYRGLTAKLAKSGLSKNEARVAAEKCFERSVCFPDGRKPFVLAANIRGSHKWCVFSGDTIDNSRLHCLPFSC